MLSEISIPLLLCTWIGVIATIKIANTLCGLARTRRFIVEHTLLNKSYMVIVCIMATFSAFQEGYYIRKEYEII